MFIIFGLRRKAHRLATIFALCASCQTPAAQVLLSVRTFFSLFFVPVLPLGIKYRTTCTMCGASTVVSAEYADRLMATASHQVETTVTDIQVGAAESPTA
ncbi:MAG TPA: hypothetical protein VG244_02595 [Acidimicrobiales bacterium]|jgi:hypothetical protein|nr:hypothetical protein [Acidimicrobiales bacterium]